MNTKQGRKFNALQTHVVPGSCWELDFYSQACVSDLLEKTEWPWEITKRLSFFLGKTH